MSAVLKLSAPSIFLNIWRPLSFCRDALGVVRSVTTLRCSRLMPKPISSGEKFLGFLEKRRGILDAVVFSGGEPLVQNSLEEALDDVIALGYKTALHTGGYRPEALRRVLPKLNWVGFDVKAPLTADAYRKSTGGYDKIDNVCQSLNALLESGVDFECRTTCDPRILAVEDIYAIADSLKNSGVKTYRLQRYRQVEDDATPDSECEKFFADKALEKYLHESFPDFAFRS